MRSTLVVLFAAACGSDVSYYGIDGGQSGGRWDTDGDGIFERRIECDQLPWDFKVPAGAIVEVDDCTDLSCGTTSLMAEDGSIHIPPCGEATAYDVLRWWFPAS